MTDSFKSSTYAREYDTAAEVPDDIVAHNAWACGNILRNPAQFPKADFDSVERDSMFLDLECLTRGLVAHPASSGGHFCNCGSH